MQPDTIFQICSNIALLGWLLLIVVSPFWWSADKFVTGIIIALLAIVYSWLIFSNFHPADMKSFGTLDGVMKLFQDKTLVTAGWIHYLAFDLFIGTWIKKNSVKHNISHWLVIIDLLFTFMLGPIGLLLYYMMRWVKTKNILLKVLNNDPCIL